jgi:pimeloyl-ACP methyl ester carboxylesterase
LLDIIEALPRRFTHFVAIDGLPFRGAPPDAPEGGYTEVLHEAVTRWLDQREKAAGSQRKPGTLDELAVRRARQNPRLGHDWLRYLVQQGARHDADGWRWKIDPSVGSGGFGPWRMGWTTDRLPGFPIPMLALIATELEQMGWEAPDIDITPLLPIHARAVFMQQTGHFIHIERPAESARLVLEFLRG